MRTQVIVATAALALVASAVSAQAGCVQGRFKPPGAVHRLPDIRKMPALRLPGGAPSSNMSDSVVGLWKVVHYDQDGNVFFDGLEQWHSDGTELELANVPPAIGNICLGVWKSLGLKTFQLSHIGLDFKTDGSSDGIFTLTSTVTTSHHGNHLEGPYDVKIYDVDGNLVQEVTGNTVGDRIPVE